MTELICDRCGATPAIVQTFCEECGPTPLCGDCTTNHIVEIRDAELLDLKVHYD